MKKSWNIYGKRVNVKIVKDLKLPTGEPCIGLYDHEKSMIYIEESLSPKDKWHTLAHEIIHAMQFRLGYHQTQMGVDFLELMAETFGNMIAENFKPNGKL